MSNNETGKKPGEDKEEADSKIKGRGNTRE
jgi:hypothetical protein